MKNSNKLTTWEWEGLTEGYNIADGHAHQEQSKEYLQIINNLPYLFLNAEKGNQKEIQNRFEKIFFGRAGQKAYKKLPPPLYQTACSLSIEVVANYLRNTNKSVTLLHPTFDNLADILKRHNILLTPIEEKNIFEPTKLTSIQTDALFLVCPNNPTGTEITKEQFLTIVDLCKKQKKLLILDCSFRCYSQLTQWDQYEILNNSGIDFIIFEDTGKFWPTLELKLGITVASQSVHPYLADITNDFLLNVSPFSFILLSEYINVELKNKEYKGAKHIVYENRKLLQAALKNTPLKMMNHTSPLSVAWIQLPNTWKATQFCKWLAKDNVHVLPGSPFFWNDPKRGESYIRIALLRPQKLVKQAIARLQKATREYKM